MTKSDEVGEGRIGMPDRAGGRDHDVAKGAVEDGRKVLITNAPGLDADGLPNDDVAIAQTAIGAREDGSQG